MGQYIQNEQQNPDKPIRFNGFDGLNTLDYPFELKNSELTICNNFDITENGKLIKRQGRVLKMAGKYTNLWRGTNCILGTHNGSLGVISNDFDSFTPIKDGFMENKVVYANIDSIVVYTDGLQCGYVYEQMAFDMPYPTESFKFPIPAGQLIETHYGRIYVAHDNILEMSDPISMGFSIDKNPELGGSSRQFSGKITLLKSVNTGLWVSDIEGLWWMQGTSLKEMKRIKKASSKAITGMFSKIDPQLYLEPQPSILYFVMTVDGVCAIGEDGYFKNLTNSKYVLPDFTHGNMTFLTGVINRVISITK